MIYMIIILKINYFNEYFLFKKIQSDIKSILKEMKLASVEEVKVKEELELKEVDLNSYLKSLETAKQTLLNTEINAGIKSAAVAIGLTGGIIAAVVTGGLAGVGN